MFAVLEILGVTEETTGSSNSGEGNSGGSGSHGQGGSASGTGGDGGHQGQGRNIIFPSVSIVRVRSEGELKIQNQSMQTFNIINRKNMREPLHDRSTTANIDGSYHHQQASNTIKVRMNSMYTHFLYLRL